MLTEKEMEFAKQLINEGLLTRPVMQAYLDKLERARQLGGNISLERWLIFRKIVTPEKLQTLKTRKRKTISCSHCATLFHIRSEDLGTTFKCKCGVFITISEQGEPAIFFPSNLGPDSHDETDEEDLHSQGVEISGEALAHEESEEDLYSQRIEIGSLDASDNHSAIALPHPKPQPAGNQEQEYTIMLDLDDDDDDDDGSDDNQAAESEAPQLALYDSGSMNQEAQDSEPPQQWLFPSCYQRECILMIDQEAPIDEVPQWWAFGDEGEEEDTEEKASAATSYLTAEEEASLTAWVGDASADANQES